MHRAICLDLQDSEVAVQADRSGLLSSTASRYLELGFRCDGFRHEGACREVPQKGERSEPM